MRKFILILSAVMIAFSFAACKRDEDHQIEEPTATPLATEQTTPNVTEAPTEVVTESSTPVVTEKPATEVTVQTDSPEIIQREGWISIDEAISLLRTFLGSYDDNGNEFIFSYESTINKAGKDYYNFRVTTLILDASGTSQQSYYGNYIISTDGIDLEEY